MSKKPTVLMILDGFGLNDKTEGNAVAQANKPNIDALMKDYPWVKGNVPVRKRTGQRTCCRSSGRTDG